MRRWYLLAFVAAFLFIGAQAMASPPVEPPPEGFVIKSNTNIQCDGDVTERESYNWKYFEGVGNIDAVTLGMLIQLPELPPGTNPAVLYLIDLLKRLVIEQGFQEGAEIAYQQDFTALDGTTTFKKNFVAVSETDATNTDNLSVDKSIDYAGHNPTSYATHEERVGLAVVSAGGGLGTASPAAGLLTLCPWASNGNGDTNSNGCHYCEGGGFNGYDRRLQLGLIRTPDKCDYPATNEGIAAGSSFKVTNLVGFSSKSRVNSVDNPALSYEVSALNGTGQIAAGFVVDLWEGATCWGQHGICIRLVGGQSDETQIPTNSSVREFRIMFQDPVPAVASRTSYKEFASADGTWGFAKKVSYTSVMPTAAASTGGFPLNQVLVP